MKKNLTEIVFILDRSGSMAGLEADTIGGFNSMIAQQKREPFTTSGMFTSTPGTRTGRSTRCSSLLPTVWKMPVIGMTARRSSA